MHQENENERKNQIISGTSTTVICVLLLLLFWFYNFHYELPEIPPEGGEVAISIGNPDEGGPEEIPIEAESQPSVPTMSQPEAVEQTLDPDAVATKKAPEPKKETKPLEKPNETDELLNSLNKGKQTQKPANAGDGPKDGQQGDKDGSKDGRTDGTLGGTSTVGGTGSNVRHSFGTRKFKLGIGKNNCNQEGTVILDVTLLANGDIRFDNVSPSSTASTCLENVAINYLKSSSFNASQNPVSVEGTITFVFKLK